jgi:hypothetical protein
LGIRFLDMKSAAVAALMIVLPVSALATVVNSSPQEFTARHTLQVRGTASAAYQAFTSQIGLWWDPEHSYSGKASNISLDARASGCFCEKLASNGSVNHMTVIFADPGKLIRMTGGLGPLQSMAVTGVMTVTFTTIPAGTRVEITYAVGGQPSHGLDKLAPLVDQVLNSQWERFSRFVDTGKP